MTNLTSPTVVDLFAGPGGWDEGLRRVGVTSVLGIEFSPDACLTAEAAGHSRLCVDVSALDPSDYASSTVLIASPPCQTWSKVTWSNPAANPLGSDHGKHAMSELDAVLACIAAQADGWVGTDAFTFKDDRTRLVFEPLRWAWGMMPEHVLCEQVTTVLPVWEAMADVLRGWGYEAATGVLNAADYGVPQTRERAFLVASLHGSASLPKPTHDRSTWVAMADVLGWTEEAPAPSAEPNEAGPSFAAQHLDPPPSRLTYIAGNQKNAAKRTLDQPAPTMAFGHAANDHRWVFPDGTSTRIDVPEASVFQTFPRDYPWRGSLTSQRLQVSNAVPPRLAAAVYQHLTNGA